jgi:hypothetical protein
VRGGDWVYVLRGTRVRNEATREATERRTSYPLRLLRVEDGRGFWLGDRDRLFSARVSDLELIPGGHRRGHKSRRELPKGRRLEPQKRTGRCPHGFLPPLCPVCDGEKA